MHLFSFLLEYLEFDGMLLSFIWLMGNRESINRQIGFYSVNIFNSFTWPKSN